ncbi:RNA 2',3'-cyclic phosphodiesterase [Metabacillus sp. 84]|uniref:RNA 2',3'-cyclic phosphodiesterase n=1 Tax=unclassified Metabacillus TaxID=2675274 RepID=UPI003CFB2B63
MGTHYFLAVRIPEQLAEQMHQQFVHDESLQFGRWVHPLDYHITLAFLGEPDTEEQLLQLTEDLTDKINKQEFTLKVSETGTFGAEESPRIFWAGVNHSEALAELREMVYQSCLHNGFKLDKRPFKPHITAARKWTGRRPYEGPSGKLPEMATFSVRSVELLETRMEDTPKYKTIRSFRLKGKQNG